MVLMSGITTATAIEFDVAYSCALVTGGTIKCWGLNERGELGDGTGGHGVSSTVPVVVSGITTATAITSSSGHSCALLTAGTIKCWGLNSDRQLGDGTTYDALVPVLVTGL